MVVELTDESFYLIVGKDKYVLVEFYTKWCKYCKNLSPIYDSLYDYYTTNYPNIIIARIEADGNPFVKQKYKVTSYPFFALFERDSYFIKDFYKGSKTYDDIKKWLDSYVGTPSTDVGVAFDDDKIAETDVRMLNQFDDDIVFVKNEIERLKKGFNEVEISIMELRKANEFVLPSNFTIFSYVGGFFIMLALCITVKKLFAKKIKEIEVHDKV